MQPIVWLAILGVAVGGLGAGFLAPGFDLSLQGLAAQTENLESPITSAKVDLEVQKITGLTTGSKVVFKNEITACSFHSPQDIGAGGAVICKLYDGDDDIVAEGRLNLPAGLSGSDTTYIDISQVTKDNANDVQNIERVKIVVLGEDPTP